MTIDADKDLLHEILCLLPVANCSINEVEQAGLISLDQFRKGSLLTAQECRHDSRIIHCVKLFPDTRSLLLHCLLTSDYCHGATPRELESDEKGTGFCLLAEILRILPVAEHMPVMEHAITH